VACREINGFSSERSGCGADPQNHRVQTCWAGGRVNVKTLIRALPKPKKSVAWAEAQLERALQGEVVEPKALAEALAARLSGLAPFILAFEDLHESDADRLEIIQQMAHAISRIRGVGLLVTSRIQPPKPFKSQRLEPLEQNETRDMLERQLGGALPTEGFEWIHHRTQGNPLFALEYLRYLALQGFLWNDGTLWRWRKPADDFVPVTVEALIEQVIQQASTTLELEVVIGARVMLGIRADWPLWATVAGLTEPALEEASLELERLGLFHAHDFAHPLYREVADRLLTPDRRHIFAQRALEILEHDPQEAAGFVEAANLMPSEKRGYYERAAQAAEASGQALQAGRWLVRAVEYAHGFERGALAFRAAKYLDSINPPETIRLLEIAVLEHPNDPETMIALAREYGRTGLTLKMNQVLEHLPSDAITKANWIKSLIMVHYGQRDFNAVLKLWDEHPELHAQLDPDTANRIGFARMELGDPEGAQALVVPVLQASELTPSQRCNLLVVHGLARRLTGDLEAARTILDEAVLHARAAQQPVTLASALHNRQVILNRLGLIPETIADLNEAIALYRNAGFIVKCASSLGQLGRILSHSGHQEEGEVRLLEAHEMLLRFDDSSYLVAGELSLCEMNLCSHYLNWRPPYALQLAQKYIQLARKRTLQGKNRGFALYMASSIATESGRADQGLALAVEGLELEHLDSEVRSATFVAQALAFEALNSKTEAFHALKEARSIASGLNVHMIDLELARFRNDFGAAQAILEWFRERNLVSIVNDTLRRWPALSLDAATAPSLDVQTSTRLEVLGTFRSERDGQTVTYRGRKRSEILAYLLEARIAGRNEVGTLELLDAFYPNDPEPEAKNVLRQQMYLIRAKLGTETVISTAGGYALGAVNSDAEDFLMTGDPMLWRGAYLEGLSEGWLSSVRDALILALRSTLEALLESNPREAARLARILFEMEPYDLGAFRLNLLALLACGDDRAASRLFAEQRDQLIAVDEHLPRSLEAFLSETPGALPA
jgi:tetratricopeptide (TPR) repeat protein